MVEGPQTTCRTFPGRSVFAPFVATLLTLVACSSNSGSGETPTPRTAASGTQTNTPTESAVDASETSKAAVKPSPHLPLPAGTYSSETFATPVTYTVPDGWKMFEDEQGQFGLALVANDGPCVCFWRDVRAAAVNCTEAPEPKVGASAANITLWLAQRQGLKTTKPKPVKVGGLSGYEIDVAVDPAWRGCGGTAPTLIGTGISTGVLWGSSPDSSQRIYLLDLGKGGVDGNIAINVEVCCGVDFSERTTAVSPIIESLDFQS